MKNKMRTYAVMYPDQEVIRKARKARGWTQYELAVRLDVSIYSVCVYERGYIYAPWDKLCEVMPELEQYRPEVRPEIKKPRPIRYPEQIVIRIARMKRHWSLKDFADHIYYSTKHVSDFELGRSVAPWEVLYTAMPELKEMREKGCEAYCSQPRPCLGGGTCRYVARRERPRENDFTPGGA